MRILSKFFYSATAVLFPANCYGCGKLGRYLCADCARHRLLHIYQPICIVCGQESIKSGIHQKCREYSYLHDFYAVCRSSSVIGRMLHEGKYRFSYELYKDLARLIAVKSSEWKLDDAIVTWVPQSEYRTKWRGFNQAQVLAEEFARLTARRAVEIFERDHNKINQVGLKREGRLQNLRGQIKIKETLAEPLAANCVIIVDDVFTTGATLQECAKLLVAAGANPCGITIVRV